MSRPTRLLMDTGALLHNVGVIKQFAPHQQIIAMVKANAYGCGLANILPTLEPVVDAFGVAFLDEGLALRALSPDARCILFQGVYGQDELILAADQGLECVVHQARQLEWILNTPLNNPLSVWIKVDTGLHRLGFEVDEVASVVDQLSACPWVSNTLGLMTHLACADERDHPMSDLQMQKWRDISPGHVKLIRSVANSAGIIQWPHTHEDAIRPGVMLYGISSVAGQLGTDLGLKPVLCFESAVMAMHHVPAHASVGYGAIWKSTRPSVIGVIPAGYGDGYPRNIETDMPVWVGGKLVPIVGRVSMDALMIDLTDSPDVIIGDKVELWGQHVPIELVASKAGTIPHELMTKVSLRVNRHVRDAAIENMVAAKEVDSSIYY